MQQSLCQLLSSNPVQALPATSPYVQNITFAHYGGALHPGAGPLQYQVLYSMLFPDPSKLSPSNALEAGLLQGASVGIANVTDSSGGPQPVVTVTFDSNGHIEGVQALVTVESGQYLDGGWLQLTTNTVVLTGRCGCFATNPDGIVLNPTVVQSLGVDNTLTVSFLPQSLCAKDYKIQQWNASAGAALVVRCAAAHPADLLR